jgi:hypothetical protein
VIIAVVSMRMMQVAVHKVIYMIAVWNRFVAASAAVLVAGVVAPTGMLRSAVRRIGCADFQNVLVDMIAVRLMQMSVV